MQKRTPIPELVAEHWIIVHRDVRRLACVRAVMDRVRQAFAEQRELMAGAAWSMLAEASRVTEEQLRALRDIPLRAEWADQCRSVEGRLRGKLQRSSTAEVSAAYS